MGAFYTCLWYILMTEVFSVDIPTIEPKICWDSFYISIEMSRLGVSPNPGTIWSVLAVRVRNSGHILQDTFFNLTIQIKFLQEYLGECAFRQLYLSTRLSRFPKSSVLWSASGRRFIQRLVPQLLSRTIAASFSLHEPGHAERTIQPGNSKSDDRDFHNIVMHSG